MGESMDKKKALLLYFKGMAMGAADSVPGISGGTIALVTNIYEELIFSLQSINFKALRILTSQGFAAAWRHVNGNFLLVLLAGVLTSLVLLANLVIFLLDNFNEELLAFFAGLILASSWYVSTKIRRWHWSHGLSVMAGAAVAVSLAFVPESAAQPSLLYFFLCGAVAICAMILPGISGAFILILLGAYAPVLDALRNTQIPVILVFAAGCASGLIAFSNVLAWLFRHYHDQTLVFLFGIMLGSLYSIWPWKEPVAFRLDEGGEAVPVLYRNISPEEYSALTGADVNLVPMALLLAAGFLLVYLLEKFAAARKAAA